MNILFVCIENSNRSQMAQAFTRMLGPSVVSVHSAGSRPSGQVNPKAIKAMAELGYDLSTHESTSLNDIPELEWDYVISMGCGEKCPWVPSKNRLDWDITDPKDLPEEDFNKVRDQIKQHVQDLLSSINHSIMSDDNKENQEEKSKLRSETAERYYLYFIQHLSMRIQFSDKITDERKEELNEELINNEPTLEWMANVADELGFMPQFDFKERPAPPPSVEDLKTKSGIIKHLLDTEGFYDAEEFYPFNWDEVSFRTAEGVKLEANIEDFEEDPEDENKMVPVLYPEDLDFENMSPIEVTDEHIKFIAGGDWQIGSILTMKLGEDDVLYITDCYMLKNDETDPKFNHLSTDDEIAAFGLPAREKA